MHRFSVGTQMHSFFNQFVAAEAENETGGDIQPPDSCLPWLHNLIVHLQSILLDPKRYGHGIVSDSDFSKVEESLEIEKQLLDNASEEKDIQKNNQLVQKIWELLSSLDYYGDDVSVMVAEIKKIKMSF